LAQFSGPLLRKLLWGLCVVIFIAILSGSLQPFSLCEKLLQIFNLV
jgi:hypothetical protein